MIGGTGRCDFQSGDAAAQYDSLFNKLLRLPDDTLVFPAHDYKGDTVSTIGEERAHNPRLQVSSVDEYEELMNGLNLPPPRLMDVVVPTEPIDRPARNEILADRGCAVTRRQFLEAIGSPDVILVDVREDHERARGGAVEGSIDVACPSLKRSLLARGIAAPTGARIRCPRDFLCVPTASARPWRWSSHASSGGPTVATSPAG